MARNAPFATFAPLRRKVGTDGKRALPICIAVAGTSQEQPFVRLVQDVEPDCYGVMISDAIIAA
jgi:hypothetical protein